MILGHGANTMTLDEARIKLCAQAKLLGRECNPAVLASALHHPGSGNDDQGIQQSKDAIIYVTIVVVFYVAIVLLLIGTNLRAGRSGRAARFKKHVVEYSEGSGAQSRLVPAKDNCLESNSAQPSTSTSAAFDMDDDIADV